MTRVHIMNNPLFEISGRKIGLDCDPLVIAEIGIMVREIKKGPTVNH